MLLVLKLPKRSRIPQNGFETARVQITSQIYLTATCYHYVSMLSRFSCVPLFTTLWNGLDCSPQAPLSMGFSRQEYWSGLPYLPPGDLPNPGIKPTSLTSASLTGRFFTTNATWEAHLDSWIMLD